MGQIQNALNQIFTSGIGTSLAWQHSPYVRGQSNIKRAGETISAIQESLANTKNPEAQEKEILPEIAGAYDAYENAILQGGTKQQIQALYEAGHFSGDPLIQGGNIPGLPYLRYEAEWPGTKSVRDTYYNDPESDNYVPYWDKQDLAKIKQAMDAKRGVKNAVPERQKSIQELAKIREKQIAQEKKEMRKEFKKPEVLL